MFFLLYIIHFNHIAQNWLKNNYNRENTHDYVSEVYFSFLMSEIHIQVFLKTSLMPKLVTLKNASFKMKFNFYKSIIRRKLL